MCKVEVEVGEMVAGYVVGVFNGDNRWRYVTRTLESATLLKKKKICDLIVRYSNSSSLSNTLSILQYFELIL